jgi:peptide deformylase
MAVLPIRITGDPVLHSPAAPVEAIDDELRTLVRDLYETMDAAPGVGLAAPQVGEALNVCVVEVDDRLHELVNPRIVRSSGEDRDLEGCLSIPGYAAYVTRKEKVWVVAQDRRGRKIKVAGSGLLGRAFQHELDHLDGKLYIDYLDSMDELIAVGLGDDEEGVAGDADAGDAGDSSRVRAPALA